MRVSPPPSLKLDREELLRDVRERLSQNLPEYREGYDPTDPAWILLDQAAWLVELLSGQLDDYPFSVLQQVMHVIGAELLPAQPAVGAVVAQVSQQGLLRTDPTKADTTRFFTPQNENKDIIEFVPVEPKVFLTKGSYTSLVEWNGTELVLSSADEASADAISGNIPGSTIWRRTGKVSTLFEDEWVMFTVATNQPEDTVKEFWSSIAMFEKRNIGWLALQARPIARDRVRIEARIDLSKPFAQTIEGGMTTGGDVEAHWGTLDESTWTPDVRVRNHSLLPPALRGSRPMPGLEDGTIVIPDVPPNFSTEKLLVRTASPIPENTVQAIWDTLTNLNTRLASLRPKITRVFAQSEDPAEPTWIQSVLQSGAWTDLTRKSGTSIAHVTGLGNAGAQELRLGLIVDPRDLRDGLSLDVYEQDSLGNIPRSPLKKRIAWRMPGVLAEGSGVPVEVVAFDVKANSTTGGLLLAYAGKPYGFLLNPLLVANAPAVRDGRTVPVRRNVPEPVSLLYEDVLNSFVIERLLKEPIGERAAAALKNLSLARFRVEGEQALVDWEGIRLDPTEGTVTLNAPDRDGKTRTFRPGRRIKLDWYRRTDGVWGNVPAGTINLAEQPPNTAPSITQVANPVGAMFGADREAAGAAVKRVFTPAGGNPVLPADFEAMFRQALGQRAEDWLVRVWTYAERSLVSTALWPFVQGADPADTARVQLQHEIAQAGPNSLLVILGPVDGSLSDLEFASAKAVVKKRVQQLRDRTGAVRDVVVGRFWPLDLQVKDDPPDIRLPSFRTNGLDGTLIDSEGRKHAPPSSSLLLNAAVVRFSEEEGRWA